MDVMQSITLSCVCFWITVTTLVVVIEYGIKPTLARLSAWWQNKKKQRATSLTPPTPPQAVPVYGSYQLAERGKIGCFDLVYSRMDGHIWIFRCTDATMEDAMMALDKQLQCGLNQADHSILQKIIKLHYIKAADALCEGK
jgi:hypothetical protein